MSIFLVLGLKFAGDEFHVDDNGFLNMKLLKTRLWIEDTEFLLQVHLQSQPFKGEYDFVLVYIKRFYYVSLVSIIDIIIIFSGIHVRCVRCVKKR